MQEWGWISKTRWRKEAKHEIIQILWFRLYENLATEISGHPGLEARKRDKYFNGENASLDVVVVTTGQYLGLSHSYMSCSVCEDCKHQTNHSWTWAPLQLVTLKKEVMSSPRQRAGLLTGFYKSSGFPKFNILQLPTQTHLREHPSWPCCVTPGGLGGRGTYANKLILMLSAVPWITYFFLWPRSFPAFASIQ